MAIRNLTLLFLILFISIYPAEHFAAVPIREHKQKPNEKLCQKINAASANYISSSLHQTEALPRNDQEESIPDSGINGSVAFAFGILGIFPVAIILGIIGMQPHRRGRGWAIAGLILGFLGLLYFIAALILLFSIL